MRTLLASDQAKRLIGCLFAGFVLSIMIGSQEGSQTDFGISFREATRTGRLLLFLLLGVAIFAVISVWPRVRPYISRPGAAAVIAGFTAVLVALVLMHWFDPVGKFGPLVTEVGKTPNIPFFAGLFFSWFGWAVWIGCLALGAAAVVTRIPLVGYAEAVLGVVAAVVCFVGHAQVVSYTHQPDHALGVYVATIGFVTSAVGGVIAARSSAQTAEPKVAFEKVMAWRPGLPIAVVGFLLGLVAFFNSSWFSPLQLDSGFTDLHTVFVGHGLSSLGVAYIDWLGLTLFALALVAALAASLLRQRALGWVALAIGVLGLVATFLTLHAITTTGSSRAPQYGATWQNLGSGGYAACIAFGMIATAGFLAATAPRVLLAEESADPVDALPVRKVVQRARTSMAFRVVPPMVILLALFYPPTLTTTWQNVLVTQIGVYILLTVGLNVVVGWAGLLDLGYIAFYGIGSYTTAYICGSLPIKPPSWLHLSPLWAIPFAIVACLIAGVLLGAPTLRLRGDYLAIVTLGFGEIIQLIAINAGGVTGGPQGPNVPHPVLKVGGLHITWGLDNLPYWYLLLVFIVIMVVLFYRIEGSRIGRAWAAIREDEVAAQATGINTTRVKLLAFAIGASTSGLAGVFFATQVGYFDPSGFTLQNSILIVAYVVFGGMGSLPGAIAGAAVLTWLPQFLKDQVPLDDRQMWIGALVLAMMIFRPAGLIPARRRAAELSHLEDEQSPDIRAVPVSEGL